MHPRRLAQLGVRFDFHDTLANYSQLGCVCELSRAVHLCGRYTPGLSEKTQQPGEESTVTENLLNTTARDKIIARELLRREA